MISNIYKKKGEDPREDKAPHTIPNNTEHRSTNTTHIVKEYETKRVTIMCRKLCVFDRFDITKQENIMRAVQEAADNQLDHRHVPEGKDEEDELDESDSEHESDEEKDELDVLQERVYGERKSNRKRKQAVSFGFQVNSSQLDFAASSSEDSDANGMA